MPKMYLFLLSNLLFFLFFMSTRLSKNQCLRFLVVVSESLQHEQLLMTAVWDSFEGCSEFVVDEYNAAERFTTLAIDDVNQDIDLNGNTINRKIIRSFVAQCERWRGFCEQFDTNMTIVVTVDPMTDRFLEFLIANYASDLVMVFMYHEGYIPGNAIVGRPLWMMQMRAYAYERMEAGMTLITTDLLEDATEIEEATDEIYGSL